MKPVFRPSDNQPGVTIIDPIHRRQFPLRTSTTVQPTSVSTSQFYFPADSAAEIITDTVVLPYVVITHIRNQDGDVLIEAEDYSYEQLPRGEYIIELNAPIKIQLRVQSDFIVASSADRMEFDFGSQTQVQIGAQSYHNRPGATITTTASPYDMMDAISMFGSALKTMSCERSLPSFRGHPPQIELGDDLHIPDGISSPETGVYLEVPPTIEKLYPISTLVYYLGATVIPGDESRLVADDGFTHSFDHSSREFEEEVERVLKQVFFLDCVTRTEGLYQVDLHERREIEEKIDLSFKDLYNMTISEQLPIYLDIPFDAIQEHIPAWSLVTHLTDDTRNVESLPYLTNNFSLLRFQKNKPNHQTTTPTPPAINGFLRGSKTKQRGKEDSDYRSYVTPTETDTLEQAWLGLGKPVRANKLLKKGFENHLNRPSSTDGIDITVVCNENEMSSEYDDGDSLYGDRNELEFDIDVHRNISVEELETILTSTSDFLHYIGHIKNNKFICKDGGLDVRSLDETAIDTFLLNGCRSYDQGKRLIEAGSIGGIVTYSEVGNESAILVGQVIARLLNRGFSIRSALAIARDQQIVGNDYIIIGDGSVEITQSESGTPLLCEIEIRNADNENKISCTTYPTLALGMGSLYSPYIGSIDSYYLNGGDIPTFTLTDEELSRFLRLEPFPVIVNDELVWSTDIDLDDL